MYAFYDSMKIDMSLQFDLLPVSQSIIQSTMALIRICKKLEAFDGKAERVTVEKTAETLSKVIEMLKMC